MLARALEPKAAHGECTVDQMRMAIVYGNVYLIVGVDDQEEIRGAACIEFTNYPSKRVAMCIALGGRFVSNEDNLSQLTDWCKSMGASELRIFSKESQTRLFMRFGFEKIYDVLGVQL